MSIFVGPNCVSSGLIFEYDANNKKSWRGGPATNYYWNSGSPFDPWTVGGTNTNITGTAEDDGPIPGAKTWRFEKSGTSNQWNGWESTYGTIWTGSSGDIWTTSYWYKTSNPAGNTGFGVGGFYTSDWSRAYNYTVLANRSDIIADGQWHFNYTVTRFNEAYTNAIIVDGPSWGYSSSAGRLYLHGLQWTKTSYASQPYNYTFGTRSNTESLLDVAGRTPLTTSSLTYSYDGTGFSFNGSSDYIIGPENSAFNTQTPTVEVWVKTNATTQNGFWFEKGNVNTQYALFQEGANITWRHTTNVGSLTAPCASYMNTSQYAHVVGTYTAGDRRIYVNGVLVASDTLNYSLPTNANGISIGVYGGYNGARGYYFNGSIGSVKVYNRALSATEVAQNFNATRGQYGV